MNRERNCQRGSVSILALTIVMIAGFVMVGVARAGSAAGRAANADTAADSAAIAAAISLARMEGPSAAYAAAREAAAANGGTLRRCDCNRDHAEVVVKVDGAIGRARAEVYLSCAIAGIECEPDR